MRTIPFLTFTAAIFAAAVSALPCSAPWSKQISSANSPAPESSKWRPVDPNNISAPSNNNKNKNEDGGLAGWKPEWGIGRFLSVLF